MVIMLETVLKVYNQTFGSQIIPIKQEDISNTVESILSKSINKKVKVIGNGLDKNTEVRIE